VAENVAAAELRLTPQDLAEIEQAVPPGQVVGERYPEAMMSLIDR
jgi:hypothetical protein